MKNKKRYPKLRFPGFTDPWKHRKLKKIVENISDGDWIESKHIFDSGKYRIVQTGNIGIGKFLNKTKSAKFINQKDFDELNANEIFPGDILISRLAEPAGRAVILPVVGTRTVTAVDVAIIRPNKKFSTYFLKTLFNAPNNLATVDALSTGSTRQRISRKNLENIKFNIPTIREQQSIGNLMKEVDQLISSNQREGIKLKNLKKAYMDKLFPKNGSKYPELRFPGFTDPWEQRKLSKHANVHSASRVHKNEWSNTGVRFFRSSDIVAAYKNQFNSPAYIDKSLYDKLIQQSGVPAKGDLLITGGGSIGIPYIIGPIYPLYFKDADVLWVKPDDKLQSKYLFFFMQTTFYKHYLSEISHIGTIAHYTIAQAGNTPIYMPTFNEQAKISEFISKVDNLIASNQREGEKLKALKQAYLNELFV